jgi:hypothetical protein
MMAGVECSVFADRRLFVSSSPAPSLRLGERVPLILGQVFFFFNLLLLHML